jgi:hypothetical protein
MPVDSPFVDMNPADTICFRIGTILRANDSLWAAADHRERLRIAARVIGGLDHELSEALAREQAQKYRADQAEQSVAGSVTAADQYRKDAEFWEIRAGRNTGKGIAIGVGISVAAYFGGRELVRSFR